MLDVYIGSQGSGKSLTSIHYLFELIDTVIVENGEEKSVKLPRHKLYKRLITNVGGFKPELFKKISGNHELEIKHYDKFLYRDDLILLFHEQAKEKEKPQEERTPTLFIYDECQFALSTFSTAQANLADCEFISNFFSLQRHYGPCDFLLMTQDIDKIHDKYLGRDFNLYISLDYALKKDPENEIIFDLYDYEGKKIITGGKNKINYKKSKKIIGDDGNEYNPFDLYVSGDAGRKPVKKKSFWYKWVYVLAILILSALILFGYVIFSLFKGTKSPKHETNTTIEANTTTQPSNQFNLNAPLLPVNSDTNSSYDKYVKEPYNNIDSQVLYRVFVMDNIYYIGTQILTIDEFKRMVEQNVFFVVSSQPVTKRSFYVNVLIHQSVLNSYGIVKDFDDSNDKRVKTGLKNTPVSSTVSK